MTGTRIVVGAAIVDRGRVLAACRSAPPALAGRWEFPGGKVEPGEREADALVRECREELGVDVRAIRRLPGAWPLAGGWVLHVWSAGLLSGEPRPLQDHSALRWLGVGELDDVDWLEQDRPAVELVRAELTPAERASTDGGSPARGDAEGADVPQNHQRDACGRA